MNHRNIITLYLCPHGDDVRAEWIIEGSPRALFDFPLADVNTKAQDLWNCAREWAACYEYGEESMAEKWSRMQLLGVVCFKSIFNEMGKVIVDSLNEAATNTIIIKQRISTLKVPWGLLSSNNEVECKLSFGQTQCITPFWGSKYSIVVDHNQFGLCENSKFTPWHFISVVNNKEFDDCKNSLDDAEQEFANQICKKSINVKDVGLNNSRKEDSIKKHHFIYVYAHGKNGGLSFDDDERTIYANDILKENVQLGEVAIFFINACDSVQSVGSMGGKIQMGPAEREIVCIATELPVHKEFAMRFGLELIDRCLHRGESVFDAMEAMWQNHLPLSLTYALYCRRDVTVSHAPQLLNETLTEKYRNLIKDVNFSHLLKLEQPK